MSIHYRQAAGPALRPFTAEVPDGAIIGIVGEDSPAQSELLRFASGIAQPVSGDVQSAGPRRWIGIQDPLSLAPVSTLALEHALAARDELIRARTRIGLERLRRGGASILLLSHEQALLRALCDEVWWVHEGGLRARGDARDVLDEYNRHVAMRLSEWSRGASQPLVPSMRRGDGRASISRIVTLDAAGQPATVWQCGEPVAVEITVRFDQPVEDPVVGIMIRTRIGFEVYGTNTELEGLKLGPVSAGQTIAIRFAFDCRLCAQQYTLTAASHDPDGVWHDWLEDAVAFSVADSRFVAGVANLAAEVSFRHV
jgi:lipopolysaccharide transport system ATP-binding protein